MRSKAKAFPYPVLGRGDDYTDSQFQSVLETTISRSEDQDGVALSYEFLLSSPEVAELVRSGKATYALDVQCSDTLYRRVFPCEPKGEMLFRDGELFGKVEIQPCIIAKTDIKELSVVDMNAEFGNAPFSLAPGDVFAIDDVQVRFIEFSRLKLESLVKVKRSDDLPDHEYKIELDGELIFIYMGPGCKRVWDQYRQDRELAPFLAMSIYKDCMHAALDALCTDGEAIELRWGRALSEKLARDGIQLPQQRSFEALSSLAQNLVSRIGILRLIRNAD